LPGVIETDVVECSSPDPNNRRESMVKYAFAVENEIDRCGACPMFVGCNCYEPECYYGIAEAEDMGPVPENCPLVRVNEQEGNV
jgi:hypothetical protein